MWTFFAIGTLWFYLLLLLSISLLILAIEKDGDDEGGSITWATVVMIVTLVILFFCGARTPFSAAYHFAVSSPITTLLIMLGYIAAGVTWSFIRWFAFLHKKKDKFVKKNSDRISGTKDAAWITKEMAYQTNVSDNKARIIAWMTYWPFSLLWRLINDPVRKIFVFIFNKLENIYSSMSKKVTEKAIKELSEKK